MSVIPRLPEPVPAAERGERRGHSTREFWHEWCWFWRTVSFMLRMEENVWKIFFVHFDQRGNTFWSKKERYFIVNFTDNCFHTSFELHLSQQILDSLVVRISACHVEGPGSIPGRGGKFFHNFDTQVKHLFLLPKKLLAPRGIEPITFALLARRSNQLS